MTPGELTLVAAGLLIATGGLDPWLFIPPSGRLLSDGVGNRLRLGAVGGRAWAPFAG